MQPRGEIEDALYGYALAYDEADIEALVACFTPDASFATNSGADAVVGAAALREFYASTRGRRAELGQQPRHLVNNVRLEQHGDDEAVAVSYMVLIVTQADGSAGVECTGRYRDTLRRTDGRWLFAERVLTFDTVPSSVRV
jgi:3-phenylpropionate/cinnamic acid dioxygenase small subunit